jgi:hypothetical protein
MFGNMTNHGVLLGGPGVWLWGPDDDDDGDGTNGWEEEKFRLRKMTNNQYGIWNDLIPSWTTTTTTMI